MDFEKYLDAMPYPPNIESVRIELMSAFDDVPMTMLQRKEKEGEIESEVLTAYKERVDAYRVEDAKLRSQFFAEAHNELGISYLPKPILDKLNELATGDYDGVEEFSRIFDDLRNLAELAELAYKVGKQEGSN